MNIVILDHLPFNPGDLDFASLEKLGHLSSYPNTSEEKIIERIQDADIVLSNKVPLRSEHICQAPKLKLISVLATGFDHIDLTSAKENGVLVCHVPAYSTASTAQTTMALLLELTQKVGEHSRAVRNGAWSKSAAFSFWNSPLTELSGKEMLIVGLGSIGLRVAKMAQSFGMNISLLKLPWREEQENCIYPYLNFEEGLKKADVISLHCPASFESASMVNQSWLSSMKQTAFLINTSRGVLIDEPALHLALKNHTIAGYASDVLSIEPPPDSHPLLQAPNCIITPHLAWATIESRRRLLEVSVQNLKAFLSKRPQHVVNA